MARLVAPALLALLLAGGCNLFAAPCDDNNDCEGAQCVDGFCDPGSVPEEDAGTSPRDAGDEPDEDAGIDAGIDAGPEEQDAGPVVDAGGGSDDAGVMRDGGPTPSFASTLDNENELANPLFGDSFGYVISSVGDPFFTDIGPPAREALLLDGVGDRVRLPVAVNAAINVSMVRGTIELDYKPLYDPADGLEHVLFSIEDQSATVQVRARKAAANNSNNLQLVVTDGTSAVEAQATVTDGTFTDGEWHSLRFTWDTSNTSSFAKIFVNGAEKGSSTGPALSMSAPDASQRWFLGTRGNAATLTPAALFDDIKIWRQARP